MRTSRSRSLLGRLSCTTGPYRSHRRYHTSPNTLGEDRPSVLSPRLEVFDQVQPIVQAELGAVFVPDVAVAWQPGVEEERGLAGVGLAVADFLGVELAAAAAEGRRPLRSRLEQVIQRGHGVV